MAVRTDRSLFEESQKVLPITGRFALTEDFASADIQCGKQIRRAVTDVVMGAFLGRIELARQHRLGPVQRWICVFSSIDRTTAPPGGRK